MRYTLATLALFGLVSAATAQQAPSPKLEDLSPELQDGARALWGQQTIPPAAIAGLKSAEERTDPVKIVGPIYYVGTRGVAAYLITTPFGHILLDGGLPQSAADFHLSIRKAGFQPEDIRLLLITEAHIDHAGTAAYFKKLSGAQVAVMERDFEHLKSGGRTDPVYGEVSPSIHFPSVTADRVLKDGDTVSLGNITMTARLGAGHTQGATTWITTVEDGGRSYNVVFPGSATVNPTYRLVINPSYITQGLLTTIAKPSACLNPCTPIFGLPLTHRLSVWRRSERARTAKALPPGSIPTVIAVTSLG
jgi:metallo-beta-lactamase class B